MLANFGIGTLVRVCLLPLFQIRLRSRLLIRFVRSAPGFVAFLHRPAAPGGLVLRLVIFAHNWPTATLSHCSAAHPRPGGARRCGGDTRSRGRRLMLEAAATYDQLAMKAEKDGAT